MKKPTSYKEKTLVVVFNQTRWTEGKRHSTASTPTSTVVVTTNPLIKPLLLCRWCTQRHVAAAHGCRCRSITVAHGRCWWTSHGAREWGRVTTLSDIIPYCHLNHSIWSLSDNKESSRWVLSGLRLVNHFKTQRGSNVCIKTPTKEGPECLHRLIPNSPLGVHYYKPLFMTW
jgi:hypothetical protein